MAKLVTRKTPIHISLPKQQITLLGKALTTMPGGLKYPSVVGNCVLQALNDLFNLSEKQFQKKYLTPKQG